MPSYECGVVIITWKDVKKVYTDQWVLLEALEVHSEGEKRIVEQMEVIGCFADDGDKAFEKYVEMHKVHKEREYYIYHTSNENLNIGIKKRIGVMI